MHDIVNMVASGCSRQQTAVSPRQAWIKREKEDVLEGGKASVCLSVSVSLRLLTDLAVVDVPRHAVASHAEQKRSESIAVPAEQTKKRAELRN